MAANTAVIVFSPAANVRGAIIWSAHHADNHGAGGAIATLVAKASAPATILDGEVIAMSENAATGTAPATNISMREPQRIAPGLGLYFLVNQASAGASTARAVRYTLL